MEDCGCQPYICEEKATLNPCVEGFTLYLNEVDGSYLVYIKIGTNTYVVQSQLENNRMFVEFEPNQYVNRGTLEISVKTLQGEAVLILFGDTCTPQCGFSIELGTGNETFLNRRCASAQTKCFTVPINNCSFNLPIQNCNYIL